MNSGIRGAGADSKDHRRHTFYGRIFAKIEGKSRNDAKAVWDFILKYLAAAVAFAGAGYRIRDINAFVASGLYFLTLGVLFRGLWPWCSKRINPLLKCS